MDDYGLLAHSKMLASTRAVFTSRGFVALSQLFCIVWLRLVLYICTLMVQTFFATDRA